MMTWEELLAQDEEDQKVNQSMLAQEPSLDQKLTESEPSASKPSSPSVPDSFLSDLIKLESQRKKDALESTSGTSGKQLFGNILAGLGDTLNRGQSNFLDTNLQSQSAARDTKRKVAFADAERDTNLGLQEQKIQEQFKAKNEADRAKKENEDPNSAVSILKRKRYAQSLGMPELENKPISASELEKVIALQNGQDQANRQDRRLELSDKKGNDANMRQDKQLVSASISRFNSVTKDLRDSLRQADKFGANVDQALTNPVAKAGLGFTAARISGSNSQLSDAERQIFQRFGLANPDTADQMIRDVTNGTLNPKYKDFYKAWAGELSKKAKAQLAQERDNAIIQTRAIISPESALDLNSAFALPEYTAAQDDVKMQRLEELRKKKAGR